MSPPGIEPGLRPSQSRVRSGTLRGLFSPLSVDLAAFLRASGQLATINNVVAEIRRTPTTSRAGVCSKCCQPSEPRFVTNRLARSISATQLLNRRRERTEPFRQAGSLPYVEYLAEESNLIRQLRTLPCFRHTREACWPQRKNAISRPGVEPGPGASETPMRSLTPSGHNSLLIKQARARGVEPRWAVLEAACSPRSTLVKGPRPVGRGLRKH
jgi:hypothetical protein